MTFKQIVIAPQPTTAAKEVARAKAESVLAQIKAGADFEKIAKRESMDLETKETGGDLGWIRRGNAASGVRALAVRIAVQAATPPGQLTPVFETPFGFHIVRVDRVQGAGEVKAHQILITAKIDSADIEKTHKLAGQRRRAAEERARRSTRSPRSTTIISAAKRRAFSTPFEREKLPVTYQKGFEGKKAGDIVSVPDRRLFEAARRAEVRRRAARDRRRGRRPNAHGDARGRSQRARAARRRAPLHRWPEEAVVRHDSSRRRHGRRGRDAEQARCAAATR